MVRQVGKKVNLFLYFISSALAQLLERITRTLGAHKGKWGAPRKGPRTYLSFQQLCKRFAPH